MMRATMLAAGLLLAALAVGCGDKKPDPVPDPKPKTDKPKTDDDHAHGNGPTGGVTFDLGSEHAELRVDHKEKTIAVAFLKEVKGKKEKDWPLLPVAAKEFTSPPRRRRRRRARSSRR